MSEPRQLDLWDMPTLWDEAPAAVAEPTVGSIQQRFEAFHARNPWVYEALVKLARDEKARHGKAGIGNLWEVLRWQYRRTTVGDEFKLNDHYRSRYARLIMDREPDLAGVFEIRDLRSE